GVDAPFGGGGQVGLDDREVGQAEEGAPGPSGGALLDLDRADVALGLVGGEPDGQVGGEAEDHVLVVAEPAGQPGPVQGGRGALRGVVGDALGDGAAVPGPDGRQVAVAEGGPAGPAGGAGPGVGVDEQVGHRPGPDLALGVEAVQPGQVAQAVRAAPGVQRVSEGLVSLVAVADDGARVAGQDAAGVDGLAGPVARVHGGEELGAGHVDVAELPGGAGGGLVGVEHASGGQQLPDPAHERAEAGGGLAPD